jgi:hypothetical protein
VRVRLPEQEFRVALVSHGEGPVLLFQADVGEESGLFQEYVDSNELLPLTCLGEFDVNISDVGNVEWGGPLVVNPRIAETELLAGRLPEEAQRQEISRLHGQNVG